jgi:tol-pal system protein YbgF
MTRLVKGALGTAAAMAAVLVFAVPAQAQRLSLAERVDRLEQQQSSAQGSGGAVDLVNRVSALQSQVQTLQGQVEELTHALEEARQRNREQYLDLDSRLGRLEGHAPAAAAPDAAALPPPRDNQPPDIDLGNPGAAAPPPVDAGFEDATGTDDVGDLTPADRAALPPDAAPLPPDTAAPGDPAAESTAYSEAFAALKDGRYAESARRFKAFIAAYPDGDLTANAWYWLGESYYVTQNYDIAEDAFQSLLDRYPDSPKAADALLKVGYSQYERKQWDDAEATLNRVVQTWPGTTAARLAQGRLRALKMETRR